jgi:hypothetical protein
MICGYEALELEKRKSSVDIACFPDSGCGDDLDITRTASGIARGILGCHRHSSGNAIACELDGAVGDSTNCCQRAGRVALSN